MAVYGYTKNYKLIKPQFDADTWHDYEYDNLDTIDAVLSAIFASGDWQGFWKSNAYYAAGGVVIDKDTDTMYKVMVEHTTSEATFAAEQTAHPDYYELWSPNNLAESWATKTDGKVSNEDYSAKAYAISTGLIDDGSAKEWAIGSGAIGNTGEYSAKKYATDAHNDYISMTTDANVVAVSSNIANVNAVGQSISNVNTVASNVSSVNTVAGVSTDVTAVASVASSVPTVANNSANVTTVANNISDVNTAALNIEAINDAPNQANAASQSASAASQSATNAANSATASANSATASADSANNSHIWAEGTDAQVQALGGVHSSKVWAEQSTNANISLTNSPYTTNRILEIPQNIKLELNNGTLTLKAGSKVYVPNGFEADGTTPKFDVVVIESDIIDAADTARQVMVWYRKSNGKYYIDSPLPSTFCYSGSTAPTSFYAGKLALWYDTNTNLIKYTRDSGATWDNQGHSLPLAIVTETTTAYISIDQIFNGFGYIGSTVFALPGVKVQTPNGRNEDGTYKSVIRTIDSVRTYNAGAWGTKNLKLIDSGGGTFQTQPEERFTYNKQFSSDANTLSYDENTGLWWFSSNQSSWVKDFVSIVGSCRVESGKITQFQVDTVDSVVNSNASNFSQAGRSYLSGLGMPSNRYIDLTLGASGSTYTAPANGYFFFSKQATAADQEVYIAIAEPLNELYAWESMVPVSGQYVQITVPVKKGYKYKVSYQLAGPTIAFRFIYAEGDQ